MPTPTPLRQSFSHAERHADFMPGMKWGQLDGQLRIGLVDGVPAADVCLRAEPQRHVSLALMLEGSGQAWMDGAPRSCPFAPRHCYLSCATERFIAVDYFPAYHRLKVAILHYRADWLDLLATPFAHGVPGTEVYRHPSLQAWVARTPMTPTLERLTEALFAEGIPARPLDWLRAQSRASAALWQVVRDLSDVSDERGFAGELDGARLADAVAAPGTPFAAPDASTRRLTGRERRLLCEARAYIDVHCLERLEVAAIGRTVGLGHTALKLGFQALFGTSVYGYVLERRLERAVALLEEGRLPVKEIACRCGFAHASHLARQFRRRYGVSPAAWRRRSG